MIAKHVVISGQVQGVWFRGWTVKQANALELSGWVRNCQDGSVEALIAGDAAAVDRMLQLFHHGPPAADVKAVLAEDWTGEIPKGFEQIATL